MSPILYPKVIKLMFLNIGRKASVPRPTVQPACGGARSYVVNRVWQLDIEMA